MSSVFSCVVPGTSVPHQIIAHVVGAETVVTVAHHDQASITLSREQVYDLISGLRQALLLTQKALS